MTFQSGYDAEMLIAAEPEIDYLSIRRKGMSMSRKTTEMNGVEVGTEIKPGCDIIMSKPPA